MLDRVAHLVLQVRDVLVLERPGEDLRQARLALLGEAADPDHGGAARLTVLGQPPGAAPDDVVAVVAQRELSLLGLARHQAERFPAHDLPWNGGEPVLLLDRARPHQLKNSCGAKRPAPPEQRATEASAPSS